MNAEQAREAEAYALGLQTVLWGMQWVKAGQTLRAATTPAMGAQLGVPDASALGVNLWVHVPSLFTHETRVVETPNTETLYSWAVVDLQDGPVVVVHPDFGTRYFRTSVWELHGDTHSISQRKDGAHPPPYALVPIGWTGPIAAGLEVIRVRSRYVLISPHIAVWGPDDLPNVRALQRGLKLIALADWGSANTELAEGRPMRPLRRPGTTTPTELQFFEALCETLKDIAVREDEAGFARQAERIGVTLSEGFGFDRLDAATVTGLKRALLDAQSIIEHKERNLTPQQPGGTWRMAHDLARLDDWLFRAAVGWKHVWGDVPGEILFPKAFTDANGDPLTGARQYTLHFAARQLPPARYWRISLYDLDGFFIDNPLRRYGIGNMAETLALNPDGSLTVFIQNESPGKANEVNWLPAPRKGFFLMMRLYQPEEQMYRDEYILPPLVPGDREP